MRERRKKREGMEKQKGKRQEEGGKDGRTRQEERDIRGQPQKNHLQE